MGSARDHTGLGAADPDELGEDLDELVERMGLVVREVRRLTQLPAASLDRSCFYIRFEDGSALKARRFATEAEARRVSALLQRMDPRHFPRVVAHHGRGLLTDWVTGRSLSVDPLDVRHIEGCGRLFAEIHSVGAPGARNQLRPSGRLEEEEQLAEDLGRLVSPGGLSQAEASRLTALAIAQIPAAYETGTAHLDYCPENLLLDRHGRVVVIDNESLSVNALDYALARCFYRWPMKIDQRRAFLAGYRAYRSPEAYLDHERYWTIRAASASALFRIVNKTARPDVPILSLRGLLDDDEGASGRALQGGP